MRKRSGKPSSSSAGTGLAESRSSRRTCCTSLSERRPISVGTRWSPEPARLADSSLEQFDALGSRRLRQTQDLRRPFECRLARPPLPKRKAICSRTSVLLMSDQQSGFSYTASQPENGQQELSNRNPHMAGETSLARLLRSMSPQLNPRRLRVLHLAPPGNANRTGDHRQLP